MFPELLLNLDMVNDVNGSLVFVNRYFGFWTELFLNFYLFIYCQLLRVAVVFVFFRKYQPINLLTQSHWTGIFSSWVYISSSIQALTMCAAIKPMIWHCYSLSFLGSQELYASQIYFLDVMDQWKKKLCAVK